MDNVIHFDQDSALNHFLDNFWTKGYKTTTTRELARSTGTSKGSLFNRFRSKREIYIRSLCRYHEMAGFRGCMITNTTVEQTDDLEVAAYLKNVAELTMGTLVSYRAWQN